MGPISTPGVAKAWPPQLRPDSTRNSLTQSPFLARNLPWVRALLKSETLRMSSFLIRPASSAKKSFGVGVVHLHREGLPLPVVGLVHLGHDVGLDPAGPEAGAELGLKLRGRPLLVAAVEPFEGGVFR